MAFQSLKPVKFNAADMQKMQSSIATQNPLEQKFTRSNDEENFPVFTTPAGGVFTVYIPNHQVQNEDGVMELRKDKLYLHTVQDGTRYGTTYRCIQGLEGVGDYDGTCPLCEAAKTSTDWFFRQCDAAGLTGKTSEQDKAARAMLNRGKVVTTSVVKYLFPIVVLEPKSDGSKGADPKPYWISMTDRQYDKLTNAMQALADIEEGQELPIPAGHLFAFNYGKSKNKAEAARDLTITLKAKGLPKETAAKLDKLTEEWTVEKGIEMVKEAELYPRAGFEQIREFADARMTADLTAIEGTPKTSAPEVLASAVVVDDVDVDVDAIIEG